MSILKYKYKAHKLINTLFYVVVFGIGFILGFGTNKIDFNKLISQVLMIDNVSATTIYTYNGTAIDEDFIYERFMENNNVNLSTQTDFDITKFPNIYCALYTTYAYKSDPGLLCYAFVNEGLNPNRLFFYQQSSKYIATYNLIRDNGINENPEIIGFTYKLKTKTFSNNYPSPQISEPDTPFFTNFSQSNVGNNGYTTLPSSMFKNTLDFSKYMEVDYWLNDGSIFKDESHQDFKEVCWENFDELMFSVTISSDKEYDVTYHEGQQEGETYIDSGFYVFDDVRKLKRGTRIKTLLQPDYKHDSSTWVSGVTFEHLHNITSEFYLMNKDELLESRYSNPVNALGNYDISRGDSYYYDNLSKLLNATYVGFTYYKNVIDDYRYDIFYLQEEKDKFCIYIPNDFVVTTLSINELGGIYGDVPTHTDKSDTYIDMESVHNNNFSYNSLFSVIKEFIASIRETINLINSYIFSFFTSLPPLAQMFIITIITLIVVKTIIWMVVK